MKKSNNYMNKMAASRGVALGAYTNIFPSREISGIGEPGGSRT